MNGEEIAEAVERHADLILKASGSGLKHYSMPSSRKAILAAVLDCYEEAYRAGAVVAAARSTAPGDA